MSSPIPLEDSHLDIIGKVRRGLGLSDADLLAKAGITEAELADVDSGNPDAPALAKVAAVLDLNVAALAAAARRAWAPAPVSLDGLAPFNTTFDDMTVNAYLVWDPASREAVAFDTGADATGLLDFAREHGLSIRLILLTHTHEDHVADLARLIEVTDAPAWVNHREPVTGAQPFTEGQTFTVGSLRIESFLTSGHSVGGTTFVVHGLARPLAIVGDAIFAGSMGGGKISFPDALANNRRHILSLPDDTVLAPGHGPLTTVGEEKAHNPFFAR